MPRRAQTIPAIDNASPTRIGRRPRKLGANPNRTKITTGLIQAGEVQGLLNITDKHAQLFGDALVLTLNNAIVSKTWEQMEPLGLATVIVNTYNQMQSRR